MPDRIHHSTVHYTHELVACIVQCGVPRAAASANCGDRTTGMIPQRRCHNVVRVVGEATEATHKRPRSAKELVGTDKGLAIVQPCSA